MDKRYSRNNEERQYNNPRRLSRAEYMQRRRLRRRKRIIRTILLTFLILILVAAIVVSAFLVIKKIKKSSDSNDKDPGITTEQINETETETENTEIEEYTEIDIIAVGDILMHSPLLRYYIQSDGTYDFTEIFSRLSDTISKADLAVCNQETPINPDSAPDGGADYIFNAPTEIGDAEISAGFDLILQSSNHSYDQGSDGILNTVSYWKGKSNQATMIGMYDSQEDRDTPAVLDINGIKIGVYNCTYGLNGFELPSDMQYLTNIISDENCDMIVSDIQKLSELSDFVIVFPHWGTEDLTVLTTEFQDYWAEVFTEAGADLIIGTHPHVCEKIEWITSDNGNTSLCYYSIGNFATNQQELPEVLCAMAVIHVIKNGDETYIDENSTGVMPLVDHNIYLGSDNGWINKVIVYKLSDYTEELAAEHDIALRWENAWGWQGEFTLENLKSLAQETFGDWIMDY